MSTYRSNASNLSFDLLLTLPRLDFTGKYFMKLNILLLDIQGRGNMRGYCGKFRTIHYISMFQHDLMIYFGLIRKCQGLG